MVDRGNFTNMMNDLSYVNDKVRCTAPLDELTPLPPGWKPDNWSVICGRGKDVFSHIGNRRFRVLIDSNLDKYVNSSTKFEKSMIVVELLDIIRDASRGGGFVRQNPKTKQWFEIGDVLAREKIGQTFRKALAARYRKAAQQKLKQCKPQTTTSTTPLHHLTGVGYNMLSKELQHIQPVPIREVSVSMFQLQRC